MTASLETTQATPSSVALTPPPDTPLSDAREVNPVTPRLSGGTPIQREHLGARKSKEEKHVALAWKPWEKWLKLSLEFSSSLNNITQRDITREMLSLFVEVEPITNLHLSTQLMLDTNGYENIYYQPDFYYSFSYASYQPNSCGFSYANYENNQFHTGENVSGFRDGTWELNCRRYAWDTQFISKLKYRPSNDYNAVALLGEKQIGDTTLSLEYERVLNYNQHKVALSAKREFDNHFFCKGNLFYYSDPDLQEYAEPDYSFSVGWQRDKVLIAYSNEYMHTRWSGRSEAGIPLLEGRIFVKIDF